MHFDLTISLGNLVIFAGILGGILRVEWLFRSYALEHELLIRDYCERKGIPLKDLLTRMKRNA